MKSKTLVNGFKVLRGDLHALIKREIDFYKVTPIVSTLFLTYRCNSKCRTCTMWQRPQDDEIKKEIDFYGWKAVIDKLAEAGVKTTELFGGNALLRKEVFVSVVKYLHKKGMHIHFPTNQIGLDEDVAMAIVKYVHTVYLSTDGVGGEQDKVRGIHGASRLAEDAVEKLLRLRNNDYKGSSCHRIVCNCTVSRFNIGSMEKMVQYASSKGFDEIHFEYAGEFEKSVVEASKIMGITPDAQYIRQDDPILANKEEAAQLKNNIRAIKKMAKNAGLVIQINNIDCLSLENLSKGTIPHKKCYIERNEVTVDPYGNIVICPFITNFTLGNLVESTFLNIWNNEKHQLFRKAQNTGRLPMCRHCILGVQRNPGVLKSLQRIYLNRIQPVLY